MKKKIPLQVLETIEPFVNKKGETFDSINPENYLLKFVDKDEESDFYFNVEQYKIENGLQLIVDYKPQSKQSTANRKTWINADALEQYFTTWLTLLEGYDKVKTVFDDPILEAYTDEYFSEFEIIEDGSDIKPFSTKQVLLLDTHLSSIDKKIEKFQTPENKNEIIQIKKDVEELRNNLTKKSKKWVVKQLSKIWAKITKQGPVVMKDLLSEAKKQVVKEGVKYIFEKAIEAIS